MRLKASVFHRGSSGSKVIILDLSTPMLGVMITALDVKDPFDVSTVTAFADLLTLLTL